MADDPRALYGDPDEATDEPGLSQPWLDLLETARKAGFSDYEKRAENIDKQYADMARLASTVREREMQVFWANVQVLAPSIYARPPVPVVVPQWKDGDELPRVASELLERAAVSTFAAQDIDAVMRAIRDDLVVAGRGVAWLRYENGDGKGEYVCIDYLDRRDFLHDPARIWREVDWAARRAYLTRREAKQRFPRIDWTIEGAFDVRKDEHGNDDGKEKIEVWEIWCKSANLVVWVSEGVEKVLDSGKPHLTLESFFPCPRPAYSTVQRGSLIPIPDFLYYKDQLEEINALTNRINALSDGLRLKGFYPAGSGDIGDAIEAALKNTNDRAVLIPVSNWAMLGNGDASKTIVWLPLEQVAATITALVALRKQVIDDVYQITGLSDIMRGTTEASETLGAQKLKSQYGSVRVRDRQEELVRIARDIARMTGEIMAENFAAKTLLDMTQMRIPSDRDIKEQQQAIVAKVQQAAADPRIAQMAQQQPDKAQAVIAQAKQQAAALGQKPTVENIMAFLRDQRMRAFVIDIETDSTIQPDEDAAKERASEFVTAVGGFLGQSLPLVQEVPQAGKLVAETLKFIASQYRAGRDLEGVIDDFADQIEQQAGQPKPPSPEAQKAQAEAQAMQGKMQADQARAMADMQAKKQDAEARVAEIQAKAQAAAEKHQQDMEKGGLDLEMTRLKLQLAQFEVMKAIQPEPQAVPEQKPPAEVIAFKDMPPEGQAQMAAQAGITLSPEQIQAHADAQDAKEAAAAAAKAKVAPAGSPTNA